MLEHAATSISLLTLPEMDSETEPLPKGDERSEMFVLEANKYFETLDASILLIYYAPKINFPSQSIHLALRTVLAHLRHTRTSPNSIIAPPPNFIPPSFGVGLPMDPSAPQPKPKPEGTLRGLQETRIERDAWRSLVEALQRLKEAPPQAIYIPPPPPPAFDPPQAPAQIERAEATNAQPPPPAPPPTLDLSLPATSLMHAHHILSPVLTTVPSPYPHTASQLNLSLHPHSTHTHTPVSVSPAFAQFQLPAAPGVASIPGLTLASSTISLSPIPGLSNLPTVGGIPPPHPLDMTDTLSLHSMDGIPGFIHPSALPPRPQPQQPLPENLGVHLRDGTLREHTPPPWAEQGRAAAEAAERRQTLHPAQGGSGLR